MTDLTPEARVNLRDDLKHHFYLAVARGVDTGRYRLSAAEGNEQNVFPGPMFSVLEPDGLMQEKFDSFITREDR